MDINQKKREYAYITEQQSILRQELKELREKRQELTVTNQQLHKQFTEIAEIITEHDNPNKATVQKRIT